MLDALPKENPPTHKYRASWVSLDISASWLIFSLTSQRRLVESGIPLDPVVWLDSSSALVCRRMWLLRTAGDYSLIPALMLDWKMPHDKWCSKRRFLDLLSVLWQHGDVFGVQSLAEWHPTNANPKVSSSRCSALCQEIAALPR